MAKTSEPVFLMDNETGKIFKLSPLDVDVIRAWKQTTKYGIDINSPGSNIELTWLTLYQAAKTAKLQYSELPFESDDESVDTFLCHYSTVELEDGDVFEQVGPFGLSKMQRAKLQTSASEEDSPRLIFVDVPASKKSGQH